MTIDHGPLRRVHVRLLASLVALSFGLSAFTLHARADFEDDTPVIAELFLQETGIDPLEEQVRLRLEVRLQEAIRLGIVDAATLAGLGFADSTPDATSTPSTIRDRDRIRERLRERIRDQLRYWDAIAPEWRGAFEQLRERLRTCRTEGGGICLEEYRVQLQFRHAEQVEVMLRERLGEVEDDEELRQMEQEQERARTRVETMLENGDADTLDGLGITRQDMERLRDRLREQEQFNDGSTTSVVSSSTSDDGKGSKQP